jgi:hypothetical protein
MGGITLDDGTRTPAADGDIIGGMIGDWLVAGWFTPNYRPLAEKLAANLAQYDAPFHLWAKPKLEAGWNTWRKPSVVLETMDRYPGRLVVLMDVDCTVGGDIGDLTHVVGDVCLTINARPVRLLWPPHERIVVKALSRVVVFRPTEGARRIAAEWSRQCEATHYAGDEAALRATFLTCPGVSFSHLDRRYAGLNGVAGAVISHESAHAGRRPSTVREHLKAIERRFRTGRTRAAKQAGLG